MAMSETASIVYDTYAAVSRLTAAGMPEPHAKAVVGEQVHLIQHNLATKADVEQIRAEVETSRLETKAEIEKLRLETNAEIAAVRGDVEKLRLETNASIDALRQETKAGIEVLRQEIKANTETAKHDIVRWIVTMGLAIVGILAGLVVAVIRHI